MSNDIKLCPCPCCNAEARVMIPTGHYFTFYQVVCTECGLASTATSTVDRTVEFWNTRKAMSKIVEKLEELDDDCGCGKIDVWKAIEIVKAGGKV